MINQEYKDGYSEACTIVEKEILRLEHVGKITGDPNTYWKIITAKRIEELLTEHWEQLTFESEFLEAIGDGDLKEKEETNVEA
jgi:hypothetical protein